MSNIKIFNFNPHTVRIHIDEKYQPWFCLTDICNILEVGNSSDVVKRLSEDGVDKIEVTDRTGRLQLSSFVNEPNLYRVIFRSNKAEAKKF